MAQQARRAKRRGCTTCHGTAPIALRVRVFYGLGMSLPDSGLSHDEVLERLRSLRGDDARWQDGRTFGLVYDGGPEVHAIAEDAAAMYLHENALNTLAIPSLGQIQREVVGTMAALLHGDDATGFMTSGGTESILMAVKTARERARAERGIERGEIVLADTAHAAFHKAAHYFGLDVVLVPCAEDYRCDIDATANAITDRTVLVVGSAPQYPHGVIDPIEDLARIGAEASANVHVDACMGGFVLPFMERLGAACKARGRAHRWPLPGPSCTDSASRATSNSPERRSTPPARSRRACGRSTASRSLANRRRRFWPSGSTTAGTRGSTSSRSVKRLLGGAGISTGRTIPMPCTPPSATAMRRSPTNSLPILPMPSRRPSEPPPTTATPPTPRSTSGPQDHPLGCRHRQRRRHCDHHPQPARTPQLLDGAYAHRVAAPPPDRRGPP
ncbi:MAG: aminotransferase class V-fold PLP-dependent enzyme [Actinobacteria bacterium]|nr:aminotransferase class V-fold PLP-dependent enzyme [Actinomycetota bacterium]